MFINQTQIVQKWLTFQAASDRSILSDLYSPTSLRRNAFAPPPVDFPIFWCHLETSTVPHCKFAPLIATLGAILFPFPAKNSSTFEWSCKNGKIWSWNASPFWCDRSAPTVEFSSLWSPLRCLLVASTDCEFYVPSKWAQAMIKNSKPKENLKNISQITWQFAHACH